MSDRYGSYPPDEPIIGAPPPGSEPSARGAGIGYEPVEAEADYYDDEEAGWDDESYDADYDEYGYAEDEDAYYDDGYYIDDESPARQPLFYLFVVAAVLVGAAAIFLLFSLVRSGDDGGGGVAADFRVSLDSPRNGDRVEIGKETQVMVSATATEEIAKFELLVDGKVVDQVNAMPPATGSVYHATMRTTFQEKGERELWVRVTSVSGATQDTDKVKVVAVEDIGDRPVRIKGKVLASVTMRAGPGNDSDSHGTLQPGREIDVIGKTRNGEWLLIDVDGGSWVPRTAIELLDSIDLVPVKEPTPTPQPTPTETPEPSPTPTPEETLPDFAPTDAFLIDGGRALRVTVTNRSTTTYEGMLVVSATGVGASPPSKAFEVVLAGNSSITVDFDVDPPVMEQKTVNVKVDPDNAIEEMVEDNNSANFVLQPPVEQPSLALHTPSVSETSIKIVVQNNGGEMQTSNVYVQVKVDETGETVQSAARSLALAKGQTAEFTTSRPQGTGTATITVLVNGQPMASITVSLGG
ncbi:MAG: SH3 domain-containing protein [Dehalococcoidia bacterium]|nr:SH3 domain-containing protein [Dehalococcoidia bacterium]